MNLEITGKIVKGYPLESNDYQGKTYKEKSIHVKTGGDYPQDIKIMFKGDKIETMKAFVKDGKLNTSDSFLFKCNLKSRIWINKQGKELFFSEFICWAFNDSG